MELTKLLEIIGFVKIDEYIRSTERYYITHDKLPYYFSILLTNDNTYDYRLVNENYYEPLCVSDNSVDIIIQLKTFFKIKLRKYKLKNLLNV